jgi:hypothetical protein
MSNNKLTLLNGIFAQEEASEILINLYDLNINFLKLKNFSSLVRYEKTDENAQKTLQELQDNLEKIKEIIADAKLNNKSLIISSEVNISYSDDN